MKQNIAIWFLFLAQTLMLGHNLIPHHHQDPFESLFIKSQQCSHHHHDYPYGMLETMFSLVPHSEKGMEATHSVHIEHPVSKQTLVLLAVHGEDFKFSGNFISIKDSFASYRDDLDPEAKLLPSGLRAPPFFA
jgi:hypothetical protein